MSWRTVVISKRCKLNYSMGYMVIRGEETNRIFLDEIALLIIENPAIVTYVKYKRLTNIRYSVIII